jgi:release factor glutamine methyltransferase
MTIREALQKARAALSQSDAPDLDAERLLLFHLKQQESAWLVSHSDQELTAAQQQEFQRLVAERAIGTPLAYILGEWEFYSRRFMVTPDVLVPRPSTEKLVDAALEAIKKVSKKLGRPITVADIGTGSGCIGITLVLETSPQLVEKIIATDISEAALDVSRENAALHNVSDRIQFVLGDLLEPLADKPVDLIVSNPPYIPSGELNSPTSPETRGLQFEPQLALDGGKNGSDYIYHIEQSSLPQIIEIQGGSIQIKNL